MRHQILSVLLATLAAASAASGQVVHAPLYPFNGDSEGDRFGVSVSGAGDVNNDGFDDFIVAAKQNDANGTESGMVRVFSGRSGKTLYTFYGDSAGDYFGSSVDGAGDVNNDGYDDLIIGAEFDDNSGAYAGSARVFSGADGSILYIFNGGSPSEFFGTSVSGAGDVNNDGFDDLIIGAFGDNTSGPSAGSARVFDGRDGSVLYTFFGSSSNGGFGISVGSAGDVNNDGFDDLIVGSFSNSVRVHSGADGSILYIFNGDSPSDFFGLSVSGAGDVNNDGFDDLIIGAYGAGSGGPNSGRARVFSGSTGALVYTFNGGSAGDLFGISVSGAGDVNNDGFDDVIVGAIGEDANGQDSGSARVYSGATGAILATFTGESASDGFGVSVRGAGDVNNDGFDDLIIGAYNSDSNGADSGAAYVFRSIALPAPPAPCPGDADGNRSVTFLDITTVLSNFGNGCP